jgi:hypothetical protein
MNREPDKGWHDHHRVGVRPYPCASPVARPVRLVLDASLRATSSVLSGAVGLVLKQRGETLGGDPCGQPAGDDPLPPDARGTAGWMARVRFNARRHFPSRSPRWSGSPSHGGRTADAGSQRGAMVGDAPARWPRGGRLLPGSRRPRHRLRSARATTECEVVAFPLLVVAFLGAELRGLGGIVPGLLFLAVTAFIADLLSG